MTRTYEIPRPVPRLRHCTVGGWVTLAGDTKPRSLWHVDDQYGYFRDTSIVSLSHPVNPALMEFGEGDWRQKCTST